VAQSSDAVATGLPDADRILIIKLAALGDFIQALGPMQAIRQAYPAAHLTLLTTAPYRGLAEASSLFDTILLDDRPSFWNLPGVLDLRRTLRNTKPDFVFDLQTSDRSSAYYRLFAPGKPLWSGIAKGCSHPHRNPHRDQLHTIDRQREQLAQAGVPNVRLPDLSFLPDVDPTQFGLPERYALLAPGGSPDRPKKRWPALHFAALANRLAEHGLTPVILGREQEEGEAAAVILEQCPAAQSLLDKTSLLELAPLARRAVLAVGNDTGPMHFIGPSNCPSVVLFSEDSNPALCAPRGGKVGVLVRPDLKDLPPEDVIAALPIPPLP